MAERPSEGDPAPEFSLPTQTSDTPITLADFRCMTIDTHERRILVDCGQLATHILSQPIFVMAFGTGGDWHIRFEPSHGG